MVRPTLSPVLYEQMIGRGLRGPKMGGTQSCLVVDFAENFGRFDEPKAWERWWEVWPPTGDGLALTAGARDEWRLWLAEPTDSDIE